MKVNACFFDLDNTLYDYDAAHAVGMRSVAEFARDRLSLPEGEFLRLYEESMALQKRRSGETSAAIHNRVIRFQLMLELLKKPPLLAPDLTRAYWDAFLGAVHPNASATACIAKLKELGVRVGVGTNMTADYQYEKLRRLDLLSALDWMVSSEEAGVEKPGGRFFTCCAGKAGVRGSACVFVGDDLEMDALGAYRAGLTAVWLCADGSDRPLPRGVTRIRSLAELPDTLLAL